MNGLGIKDIKQSNNQYISLFHTITLCIVMSLLSAAYPSLVEKLLLI